MAAHLRIEDIAQAAGVSVSTVSRILNNKPDVAAATRARVLQIIDELGYRPHSQAQSLAAGRSRTIALLFPATHAGFSELELDFFVGAARAASEHNYFFNLMTEPLTESDLLGLYRSANLDGIILMRICFEDERVNALRKSGDPFVMIGRCADNTGLSYIDLDFAGAVGVAFDHLIGLGHRHIGLLTLPVWMREQQFGPAMRLLEGYEQVKATRRCEPTYRECERTPEVIYETTIEMLRTHPQLSAMVTSNGVTATSVIRAVQDCGRRVPEDFSVMGITTTKIARLLSPTLTAINFPTGQMGYRAAQVLIHKLEGAPAETSQIVLAPELVVRESTGSR
ncbi:MAG: LacI family transcriptional regulator [Anaerolineae bacterium]|nr:LacI family transcriptional regulator [Anaerolineae bacterium]